MDLFTLIKVVLSRWRVVIPIAVLTLGVAYLVQTTIPPEYEANGYLVLDAPEANGATGAISTVDVEALAQGIDLEGDMEGRNFTVASLGGANYSVAAAAPNADRAEGDAEAVVELLGQRVRAIQDEEGVAESGRIELRLVDPQIVAEVQADGSFLAVATAFLNDPAASVENPYPPTSYTGRLLQVSVMGDSGQARFSALTGGGVLMEVGQESRDAAPLLQILTTGGDPQTVIDGFFHARDIMIEDLTARQDRAGLLPRQRTTISVLDAPLGVVDQSPPVQRATAAVIALGGLLALGLAFGLESLDRRGTSLSIRNLIDADHDGAPYEAPASGRSPAGTGAARHHERQPATRTGGLRPYEGATVPESRSNLGDRLRQALADPDDTARPTDHVATRTSTSNGSGRTREAGSGTSPGTVTRSRTGTANASTRPADDDHEG